MTERNERIWQKISADLQKAMGFRPLSDEQIEEILEAVDEGPLSEKEIEKMVRAVTQGKKRKRRERKDILGLEWLKKNIDIDLNLVGNEMSLALNRNLEEEDPEVDNLVNQLRKKVLDEENCEKEKRSSGDGEGSSFDESGEGR